MKRILLIISAILFFLCSSIGVQAQCEDVTIIGQGIDITQPQVCAEVTISLSASYTLLSVADPSKVQIRVYWNDGVSEPETFQATETSPGSKTFKILKEKTYREGDECSYEPEAYLVYDGRFCASSRQAQRFAAWSTDNANPGPVAIDPKEAKYCPGSSIDNFVFYDNTQFNCNITIEPDKPNRLTRWVQFIYNTNPDNGNLIRDIDVNGQPATDSNGNFLTEIIGNIEEIPVPADGSYQLSLPISAPAGSPVGSFFEITLRNWNVCNPYDDPNIEGPPADLINGDNPPVTTTARLVIVDPPEAAMTVKNKENIESVNFCPNELVTFEGEEINNFADIEYKWEIFNDEDGSELLTSSTQKNFDFTDGFPSVGTKLVKLSIRRVDTFNDCWDEVSKVVHVYAAPNLNGFINGENVEAMSFCLGENVTHQDVEHTYEMRSENDFTYEFKLFKRNSNSNEPDSTNLGETTATGNTNVISTYSAQYVQPGEYKVWLVAKDLVTGCESISEQTIQIFSTPVPDFSYSNLCVGEEALFVDQSELPVSVLGDAIISYQWDVDYNGSSFDFDYELSTNDPVAHTYTAAGSYKVALRLVTGGNCEVFTVKEVTVYPVPEAKLSYDYTEPICPGENVNFENISVNTDPLFTSGVNYWLVWTDGTDTLETAFTDPQMPLSFSNSTDNEMLYTVWLKAVAADGGCGSVSDPLEVRVKPGAGANFTEPTYSIFDPNCSPREFNFTVDAATLGLEADSHTWVIYEDGVEVYERTFLPTDDEFAVLTYAGLNTGNSGKIIEVHLLATKEGKCIRPAVQRYRINPTPAAEIFPLTVTNECEYTYVQVKVEDMEGIRELHWTIYPEPENIASVQYSDDFVLIYPRPARNMPAYQVELSLVKENYFDCTSEEVKQQVNVIPQELEQVDLQLIGEGEGCSPLDVMFRNATNAPTGTEYELLIKQGSQEETTASLESDALTGDFTYTFTETGSYIVRLKAIAPDGCVLFSQTPINLVVYDDPQTGFTLDKTEGCAPLTASFISNLPPGQTNSWTITDLTSGEVVYSAAQMPELYTFTNSGSAVKSYEIKLAAVSANSCVADSSLIVQVSPESLADFELLNGPELCADYEIQLRNISQGPAGTVYTWNFGDGTTASGTEGEELSHTYTNSSFTNTIYKTISLTAVTPEGCSTTVSKEIQLLPQVNVAVTPNTTEGCAPLQVYFRNNSQGVSNHAWEVREKGTTGAPFYTSTASLPEIPDLTNNSDQAKVYEILYTGSNASGCSGSVVTEVTVNPGTEAAFSMNQDDALCAESTVIFTNLNVQPGVQYVWQWGDGEPNDTTTSETELTHTFTNSSTSRVKQYEVRLLAYREDSGCTSISTGVVTVNPAVQAAVSPDLNRGCAPLQVNFTNQSQNVASHSWYVREAGTNQQEQLQTSASAQFELNNTTAGIKLYEVVYIGTSSSGCADSSVNTIEVYPALDPFFTTDSVRVRLPNSTFQIQNETPNADAWTYRWDFGDGSSSQEVHPGSHTYQTYGRYTITLTISNGMCSESYAQEVVVNEILPIVDFESIPVAGCWPLEVTFRNNSQYADPNTYYWDFGDGEGFSRAINPSYTYFHPGEYTVTLSASNPSGEVVSTSYAIVTVYERPRIDFEVREPVVYVPGDPVYVANHTRGAVSYHWDFGDGTTYTDFEPVHYYEEPGVYTITLIAENEYGCADTLVREEIVTAEAGGRARIPNAFTPGLSGSNGGNIDAGNNDVFYPVLEGGVSRYNLKIYNRWGELLFETNERAIGWDGYYKGQLCKADVYVYKLSVEFSDGRTMDKLGDVTLIR